MNSAGESESDIGTWYYWQYRNSANTAWVDMPNVYSEQHETKFCDGVKDFEYDVPYYGGTYHYSVCFEAMTQTNIKTQKIRAIRRLAYSIKESYTNEGAGH